MTPINNKEPLALSVVLVPQSFDLQHFLADLQDDDQQAENIADYHLRRALGWQLDHKRNYEQKEVEQHLNSQDLAGSLVSVVDDHLN